MAGLGYIVEVSEILGNFVLMRIHVNLSPPTLDLSENGVILPSSDADKIYTAVTLRLSSDFIVLLSCESNTTVVIVY